jgi:signal transduction histidine kinase/Na+/proline symporter
MNSILLGIVSFLYLGCLFVIAYWAESRTNKGKSLVNNAYVYALSLAVYCTAWTFYGSVGRASTQGFDFLTVYLGPTIVTALFWFVLRKIIRICKVQRITSIADFISSRYGKNRSLGILVTLICLFAGIPYISLQFKAIESSFSILSGIHSSGYFFTDHTFYIVILLSVFTILFGTRKIEATERHEGMVFSIAVESIIKLVAFLVVGSYVTWVVFDGFQDIFVKAQKLPKFTEIITFSTQKNTTTWFWWFVLSMLAFMFLPRQFQVSVIENVNEKHLKRAMWLFPLYMFLMNIFVIPVALSGNLIFQKENIINPDNYVLAIPLHYSNELLALATYIGGFSAATSFIIVETIAISFMVSNNLLMPTLLGIPPFKNLISHNPSTFIQAIRRFSIVAILFLGYFYLKSVGEKYSLVSIGMIAFVAVAQFAPSVIGGIFWKNGTQKGAMAGLLAGAIVWVFTLVMPSIINAGILPQSIMTNGLFGVGFLKPFELFGMAGMDSISHATFWSMFLNIGLYFFVSLFSSQTSIEHNQAVLFVDVFKFSQSSENSTIWRGTALMKDIASLLTSFIGQTRSDRVLRLFANRNNINLKNKYADPKVVNYTEKVLAGIVGTASARMMVSSVAKEEEISVDEVIEILKKSQELMAVNKELQRKSNELRQLTEQLKTANEQLKQTDKLKDDFLSTVTHEIRTPLTSIKALSEIVYDNPDMEFEEKQHFLNTIVKESDRLGRLINQVLDLEKFDSGQLRINQEIIKIDDMINDAIEAIEQLAKEKGIIIKKIIYKNIPKIQGDSDRLIQVLVNLLSNSIKFVEPHQGMITITAYEEENKLKINVNDNGMGIAPEYQELIFDKFYQAQDQTIRKPKGSGLGLAISKKIIELHNGRIWVESELGKGSKFTFEIPL